MTFKKEFHKARLGLFLAFLLLLAATPTANAATFTVKNTHSSGADSLRRAIKQANSGGDHSRIVIKANGTIRLGSRLPNLRTRMAIRGPGAGKLTVRRKPGVSSTFAIFTVSQHVPVGLSRVSVANGLGSGIDVKGGLTLSHSVVRDNQGSGIEVEGFGTLTASRSRVRDNEGGGIEGDIRFITVRRSTLSGNGGRAISSDRGDITVSRSKLSGNEGGGIFSDGGDIVVSRSTLRNNCVVGGDLCNRGGAIYNHNETFLAFLTVRKSTLSGNAATQWGGGIANSGVGAKVLKSTLSGNISNGGGGGIFSSGGMRISQSTLSGNISADGGGGILSEGFLQVTQSTLSGNSSTSAAGGGGILNQYDTVQLESTIVANSPSGGNCAGAMTSLPNGHNLADDDSCGLTAQGDQPDTEPLLRALDNYGGPTKTFALRPSSPAVDAGFVFPPGPVSDQRGRPRMVNYPGVPMAVGGDNSDIGSFELQRP